MILLSRVIVYGTREIRYSSYYTVRENVRLRGARVARAEAAATPSGHTPHGIQISESGSHSSSPEICADASSADCTASFDVPNALPSTGTETDRPHGNWTAPQPPAMKARMFGWSLSAGLAHTSL